MNADVCLPPPLFSLSVCAVCVCTDACCELTMGVMVSRGALTVENAAAMGVEAEAEENENRTEDRATSHTTHTSMI